MNLFHLKLHMIIIGRSQFNKFEPDKVTYVGRYVTERYN